jgi:hypothetical protein
VGGKYIKLGAASYVLFSKHYQGVQSQENVMDGACAYMGEKRSAYCLLVGKPEGKETTWKT